MVTWDSWTWLLKCLFVSYIRRVIRHLIVARKAKPAKQTSLRKNVDPNNQAASHSVSAQPSRFRKIGWTRCTFAIDGRVDGYCKRGSVSWMLLVVRDLVVYVNVNSGWTNMNLVVLIRFRLLQMTLGWIWNFQGTCGGLPTAPTTLYFNVLQEKGPFAMGNPPQFVLGSLLDSYK